MESCLLCLTQRRDLWKITGTKAATEKNIIGKLQYIARDIFVNSTSKICIPCSKLLDKLYDFKCMICKNVPPVVTPVEEITLSMKKLCVTPKTPKSPTPKRRRVSVIDSIKKNSSDQTGASTSNDCSKVRKSLQFHDHTYTDSASTHNFEKKSPRKPVSEWISETTSICNEKNAILDDLKQKLIEHHIAALSKLSYNGASVHFRKSPADLVALDPEDVIQEMKLHLPFLFNFLDALINDNTGSKQGTIAMIYGMIIHSRNKQASLMQRLLSTLLIKNGASNQLMTRLNKFHLTLTGDSKPTLVKEFGKYNMKMISKEISHGKDGKLNGDNVDIYVRTNDIRMNNSNKDYHFFASDWTPFRVSTEDFQDHTFIREVVAQRRTVDVSPDDFLVNEAELKLFVNSFSIILGRVMMKNCEHFKWLNAVLPKHVKHEVSDIMSRQTTSHRMPIILKNEAKYDDCIQILDSYVKQLREWYNSAGRGWNKMPIFALIVPVLMVSKQFVVSILFLFYYLAHLYKWPM